MSDFLTNLAVRSVGAAGAIQPRLPALFEPPRPTGRSLPAPVIDSPAEQTQDEVSQPPRNSDPASEWAPVRRTPREIPRPGEQPEEAQVTSRPIVPVPQLSPTPVVRPAPETKSVGPQPPVPRPPAQPLWQPPAVPAAARPVPEIRERMEPAPAPQLPRPERKSPSVETVEARPLAPRAALPPSAPPEAPRAAVRPLVKPRVTPRFESPRTAAAAPRAKAAEPVIHVTIGRIEVRATPPPAETRKERAAAAPVMSLDQYLRSRAKRGGQ